MPLNSLPAAASILVVDDEPDLRTLYELTLLREGYRVETAASVGEAREQLQTQRFDVVITDMRLPDGMGMELLQDLRNQQRRERCVVMTAYGSAENAVEALRSGAFDYLTKPVDLKQFRLVVASAAQGVGGVPPRRDAGAQPLGGVGRKPRAQRRRGARRHGWGVARHAGRQAAHCQGGARHGAGAGARRVGHGQELVARALHACSQRAHGPMVAVNCGAIPENLLEAEFFGARKGSYTGATQDRDGYFQAARGGTLFLDEIGDLPLPMQAKLLRAIQERRVRPWARRRRKQPTCASSAPPTATWPPTCRQDVFARTCTTASTSSKYFFRRCASAARTCPRCAVHCWHGCRRSRACPCPRSTSVPWSRSPACPCPAMCVNWRTCCTAPSRWARKGRCA